ncbi:MAG: ABC transporter permease subunit [Oscillospiraceae bacterium]
MKKKNLLKNDAVQSLLASLGCIVFGLLVGYVVLLFIQPKGAGKAILTIIENFFTYNRAETQMKYLGSTLVKTAPLLMCSLSILFAYKVGLFNIGAAGQYVVGSCASLYAALAWGWSWLPCMLLAIAAGMAAGAIVGLAQDVLQRQRGHLRHHAQLDLPVRHQHDPHQRQGGGEPLYLPDAQRGAAGAAAVARSGQALQRQPVRHHCDTAVGHHGHPRVGRAGKDAASAMSSRRPASTSTPPNTAAWPSSATSVLTLAIAGALAALGGSLLYQTGYEQWQCTHSSVPNMGFNGICAAFLGGLNPIGAIFSSFFIQHITSGGAYVDKSLYCSQISDLITAIIIYMCGFVLFLKTAMNNAAARREERQRLAAGSAHADPEQETVSDPERGCACASTGRS